MSCSVSCMVHDTCSENQNRENSQDNLRTERNETGEGGREGLYMRDSMGGGLIIYEGWYGKQRK